MSTSGALAQLAEQLQGSSQGGPALLTSVPLTDGIAAIAQSLT